MRYFRILFLLCLATGLFAQVTKPNTYSSSKDADPKAKSILKQVKDQLQIDKGVVINFEFKYTPAESSPIIQSGTAQLKGKKFNLDLSEQTMISDGATLWTLLKKRNEVQINDAADIRNDPMSPYQLLQIHDSPDFTYVLAGDSKENGVIRDIIEFKPLDRNAEFFKIRAEIDRAKKQYKTITLYLKTGDQYSILIKTQINKSMEDSSFTWDAKKNPGMKVEDLR
ncbi:MAG: outer membrane lipoprotein carrier protein LolA [Saprospiraceae bacterium]